MKNSSRESKETNIGPDEVTTQETVKSEYVSRRGTPFEILQEGNGLWRIRMMAGGSTPRICDDRYTSRQLAEKDLIHYLAKNDKLGYAVYPGKE